MTKDTRPKSDVRRSPASWMAALARLRDLRKKGKIPFVQQMAATDCGAACLAMVLAYHGKPVSLMDVRDMSGVGRDGTNAKQIVAAARWYGLRARGVGIQMAHLEHLPPATVLHWAFDHFVVFERCGPDWVDILDPQLGRRRVPIDEFSNLFTGVALLFEPGERFEKDTDKSSRTWRYVRRILISTGHLPRLILTSLFLQIFALSVPVLTGALVDRVVPRSDEHLLLVLGVGMGTLVVFFFLMSMIRGHLLLHLRTLFDARMTLDFLDHLVELPYNFLQRRSAGDLLDRVNSNAVIREIFTAGALSGVIDGTLVLLYLVLLFWASPSIGLLILGLALLQASVVLFTRARQRELMAKALHLQARSNSHLVEMLNGIETLKLSGSEKLSVEYWTDLFTDVLNISLDRGRLDALIESLRSTLRLASPLCVLGYGTLLVLEGDLSLGTMLGLNALAAGFFVPLSNLMATASQLQLLASYIARIEDILDAPAEQDPQQVQPAPRLTGRMEIDQVSFRYTPLAPLVLRNISVTIEPGQMVAVVGRSGSGKSTLASLLMGLYVPVSGRILYDGIDLAHLDLRTVRQQVGMVAQNPYIFGNTIRANISLAEPGLPLERVAEAAELACIRDDIEAMPLKYDTPLVDAGATLSGGQRQRLALARALTTRPVILILDEATSALDSVTESQVQRALAQMACTRIVIAHRLSTVANADLILVMDGGALVEQGTHDELLARGGVYTSLVTGQLAPE